MPAGRPWSAPALALLLAVLILVVLGMYIARRRSTLRAEHQSKGASGKDGRAELVSRSGGQLIEGPRGYHRMTEASGAATLRSRPRPALLEALAAVYAWRGGVCWSKRRPPREAARDR